MTSTKKTKLSSLFISFVIVLSFCLFLLHPQIVSAQCPSEGTSFGFWTLNDPLVPCGMRNSCAGAEGQQSCTLCHFIILVKNIYDLLLSLLIIASLFLLTVGGVTYVISSGNTNLKSIAKGVITKTLTGFAIFLLSWLIVYALLLFMSANPDSNSMLGRGANWYSFTCSTTSAF
ncbi:MAG: hypothetical protein U9O20_01450 [Patescibacteria group bacterium]|nr:hypothetical protein [Patescibacteria group bacterium]